MVLLLKAQGVVQEELGGGHHYGAVCVVEPKIEHLRGWSRSVAALGEVKGRVALKTRLPASTSLQAARDWCSASPTGAHQSRLGLCAVPS